ncbi:MAG: ribosomal protein S18-alanine N-acetyltransferase [Nocardioidaceae bacterium]|nr:ribosomal protein S18-alanine N-acetyltransferase [Nocardioidaceae bacterium]
MSLLVRPAEPTDVPMIASLEETAFPLDPWSATLLAEGVSGQVPTVTVLVAVVEENVAGYAVVSVVDVDAELQRIAVVEEHRLQGVASALLTAVRAHAAAAESERVLLEVREDNLAAQAFYRRHEFTELGRRAGYFRDGTTALVLSTTLTMEE